MATLQSCRARLELIWRALSDLRFVSRTFRAAPHRDSIVTCSRWIALDHPEDMLGTPRKNRNKKGLALGAELPLAVEGSIPISHREAPSRPIPGGGDPSASSPRSKPALSLSTSASGASPLASPNLLPTSAGHTPSLSSSSSRSHRSSYHNKLSEQLANLELGVEFKLELRKEDLEVIDELGCGNGGTVSRCRHIPTKAIMAKKVSVGRFKSREEI